MRNTAKGRGQNTLNMAVDLDGFNAMISGLEQDVSAAVRPAAQAGAEVIYRAVLRNVQAIGSQTGRLKNAIYQAYSEENSGPHKATYHVSWRTGSLRNADGTKKKITGGLATAPHGHLIEYGYMQRYEMGYEDGEFFGPIVRPEKRGTAKPRKRASQAEKDAYWIPREGGPKQVAARPFMRPAFYQQGAAVAAVRAKFFELLGAK